MILGGYFLVELMSRIVCFKCRCQNGGSNQIGKQLSSAGGAEVRTFLYLGCYLVVHSSNTRDFGFIHISALGSNGFGEGCSRLLHWAKLRYGFIEQIYLRVNLCGRQEGYENHA
ncbi:hypothetical protein NPIL_680201 [Nephila pilipes]|uniref:Uncharacterized protein n=1 Tax=Nephila pilipes TaxID=299642 RepID=A0A8X6JVH7_NEPPI|nr:hypothetical protein NPIL_680201 [Nephila pilipes]